MKLAISITTYNRPKILLDQLKELVHQIEVLGWDAEIYVVNDCSERTYTMVSEYLQAIQFPTKYERFSVKQGKKRHWFIVDRIFKWYGNVKWDYAVYVQDDLIIETGFLSNLVSDFELIDHPKKTCLNYILEESRNGVRCWTPVNPIQCSFKRKIFYRTGWVELHFIANKRFFSELQHTVYPIPETRWDENELLSSGVGRQISNRLYKRRMGMFQVKKSLAKHGVHRSFMNPEERSRNPLRSV